MLELNPGLIIWTLIIFFILLVLLRVTAWKPILSALEKREEDIRSSLEQAAKAKEDAERILEENQRNLDRAGEEVQKILREGRALAEKMRHEITEKAGEESRRIIEQSRLQIEREKQEAINQLRSEVAHLAILAAGKILDENLDEKKHKKIIDKFIDDLPNN
jgi:F-type H+-transporting ATPase subunit b